MLNTHRTLESRRHGGSTATINLWPEQVKACCGTNSIFQESKVILEFVELAIQHNGEGASLAHSWPRSNSWHCEHGQV